MRNKTKNRNKKYFCKCYLQCFSCKKVLIEHKENCLIINGKQCVELISGSIRFKNYFKQLAVSFKIYSDFERLLKGVQSSYNKYSSYVEQYQYHIPSSFAYKVACVDNKLSEKLCFIGLRMQFIDSLKQFLKSMIIVKK